MAVLKKYQNKRIAIYGMGATGYSVARAFKRSNAEIVCWDDSIKVRKNIKKLKYPVNKFWSDKNFYDFIVISPGIDIAKCKIKNFLKKNRKKIITDLDIFFELNKNSTLISITGTNGKSTTCKIIEKILRTANYNVKTVGNIGVPILAQGSKKKRQILILEASSYQLQYSKLFRSRHAAILNISTDHLERHGNIKNYIKAKSKIFFAQTSSDYAYISLNKYTKAIKNIIKNKKIKSKIIIIDPSNYKFILKKINNDYFKNRGNIENLAFAYRIAKNLKVNDKIIIKALNKFKPLKHRQEIVFSKRKILCVNDSKATSFEACFQSLSSYDKIYWILGGLPKYKDNFYFNEVKNKIIKAYIIGKNTSFFKKKIKHYMSYKISYNLKSAIDNIFIDMKRLKLNENVKKTILLSPAAASFDQFKNFETRGNYFKDLITKRFKKIK